MENASKALLIAGAILIAIVLISVGVWVVGSATGMLGQVGDTTNSNAVSTFNHNFDVYQGNQKGATVKTLLNTVASNNASTESDHIIEIIITETAGDTPNAAISDAAAINAAAADIVNSAKYRVVMSGANEGYINQITITRQ